MSGRALKRRRTDATEPTISCYAKDGDRSDFYKSVCRAFEKSIQNAQRSGTGERIIKIKANKQKDHVDVNELRRCL